MTTQLWLEDFEQRVEKSGRDLIRAQGESVTVADSYLKAMERINKENVAIRDAWLALQDVLGLHSEFKIYEECECLEQGEEGHLLSDPEWSEFAFCAKSFMYLICRECCTDGEDTEMTEWCADHHDHGEGKPICPTHQAITDRIRGK